MKSPTPLQFGIKFLVVFGVLAGAFEASRGTAFEHFVVVDLILVPTAALLNLLSHHGTIALVGHSLVSGHTRLHVTRGCEGIELFLLLSAAIFAFPAPLKRKIHGFALGAALAYALSVIRLVTLDDTLRFAPQAWELMHGFLMPLVPVAIMGVYFLAWSNATPRQLSGEAGAH